MASHGRTLFIEGVLKQNPTYTDTYIITELRITVAALVFRCHAESRANCTETVTYPTRCTGNRSKAADQRLG